VIGAPSYFAAHRRPRAPADLAAHNRLALAPRESRLARAWRFVRDGAEITHAPQGNVSFSDGAALCDAACAGLGLAQLHGYYIDAALAAGRVEPVLEKFKPTPAPIWLVYPQTRHLSPKVRVFIDFMVASLR
jgi:LysR family transcriptional regulator for bpeEF and oprC